MLRPARTLLLLFGLALLPQNAIAQSPVPVSIDVPAVQVSGDFLINGSPTSSFSVELGELELDGLLGPGTGLPVGSTPDQGYGPVWMVPGTYRPIYSFQTSVFETLPLNGRVPIGPWARVDGTQPVDFEISAIPVTFDVTLNGGAFPLWPILMNDDSVLILRHVAAGDEFEIGSTLALPFTARIVPGVYDLVYSYRQGRLHPRNTHATIASGLNLSSTQTVALDLEAYTHQASVDINGQPFPASPTNFGIISIESADGSDRIELGPTFEPLPQLPLLADSYVLVYENGNGGASVPLNTRAIVDLQIVVQEPASEQFVSVSSSDILMSPVVIEGTINGSPPPASPTNYGDWVAVDAHGNETFLGETFNTTLVRNLVHETYDVLYRQVNGNFDVPLNANARVTTNHVVAGPTTISFDIPMVELTIEPTQDGAPIPASPTNYGAFELQGVEPGDRFPFSTTLDGPSATRRVIAGDYDLIYSHVNGGFLPRNTNAIVLNDFNTSDFRTFAIDLTTALIAPLHTLDGLPFPASATNSGELFLRSSIAGEVPLGTTDETPLAQRFVLDGTYAFEYEWLAGTQVPQNRRERVGYYSTMPEPGLGVGLMLGVGMLAVFTRRGSV